MSSNLEPLHKLAEGWAAVLRPSRRRLAAALVALVWVLAVLLARRGTSGARVGAAVAAFAIVGAAIAWEVLARRRARAPQAFLRSAARRVDTAGVDRALRALAFVGPDGEVRAEGVSLDLARLHVGRALAQLPSAAILDRGAHLAGRVRVAAAVVAVAGLGLIATRPWSVLEGADVLLARAGVAPAAMTWLDHVEVGARPPEYLHQAEIARDGDDLPGAPLRDRHLRPRRAAARGPQPAPQRRHHGGPVRRRRRGRGGRAVAAGAERARSASSPASEAW